jgi:FMN phosphatase YigB (HAD superfamily)
MLLKFKHAISRLTSKLGLRTSKVYAFDYWGTITDHEDIRVLICELYSRGHQIHIVSAISPGLPTANWEAYERMLTHSQHVPFTAIHLVDHNPEQKVQVLQNIQANCFWDDTPANVAAARRAGFEAILVL